MTSSQNNPSVASSDALVTHPTRDELAVMTYEEWLAYHRAQPGGWLTTAAPEYVLRDCYAERLATFDAAVNEPNTPEEPDDTDDTDDEEFS